VTLASFLGSLAAVLAVVALVKWLGLGKPAALDEDEARRIAEEVFVGHRFTEAVVDRDGRAAIAQGLTGEVALVRAHGDKWVTRLLALPTPAQADGERLIVPPGEAMFGATTLALDEREAARWAAKLRGERDA
jgi:hypothetical protein